MFRIIQNKLIQKKIRISFKNTIEAANFIKNRTLLSAKKLINQILLKKKCIIFKKYNLGVGRVPKTNNFKNSHNQGRYPIKSCLLILNLIKNIEKINNIKNKESSLILIKNLVVNKTGKYIRKRNSAFGKILNQLSVPSRFRFQTLEFKKFRSSFDVLHNDIVKIAL